MNQIHSVLGNKALLCVRKASFLDAKMDEFGRTPSERGAFAPQLVPIIEKIGTSRKCSKLLAVPCAFLPEGFAESKLHCVRQKRSRLNPTLTVHRPWEAKISRFLTAIVLSLSAAFMTGCSDVQMDVPILTEETAELETLLAEMPWVSRPMTRDASAGPSDRKIVYQFSFRTCPPCIQFKTEAWPKFEAAGIETRLVMTARRSKSTADERTAVVELARTRDWKMAENWMKANSPKGYYKTMKFTAVDGNAPREADLEKLRVQIDLLDDILAVNGIEMAYPTVLWQDAENVWRAEIGYSSGVTRDIMASMGIK